MEKAIRTGGLAIRTGGLAIRTDGRKRMVFMRKMVKKKEKELLLSGKTQNNIKTCPEAQ